MSDPEYFEPRSVREACALLAKYRDRAKAIAGGQSLMILLKKGLVRPQVLINLKSVAGLDGISFSERSGLKVGALATHHAVATSPLVQERLPVLSEAEAQVGDMEVRHAGTIGGSLCQADPNGDPAVVLLALGASVRAASAKGTRTIEVEKLFKGYFETTLRPSEILTEIHIPRPPAHTGGAYARFTLREGDYPVVSVCATVTSGGGDGVCKDARLALGSVGPTPVRARRAERRLIGREINAETIAAAARTASLQARPVGDLHGSEEYKRHLIEVLTRQALTTAMERSGQP